MVGLTRNCPHNSKALFYIFRKNHVENKGKTADRIKFKFNLKTCLRYLSSFVSLFFLSCLNNDFEYGIWRVVRATDHIKETSLKL